MVAGKNMAAGVTSHELDTSGILVEKINHSSGKSEWKIMPSDYDYSRELARASFADMLHDSERNRLYRVGLEAAIKKVKARGDKVRVLDIGTGTGLLSMMAAAEGGIESIVACEEFRPMAECASKIIEVNGFKDDVKLVRKRSTELTVGPGCDMEHRANILVTEVFDTELIGEGAIGTYNHANQELLTPDRIVVPGRARMFAQVVSSDLASNWNRLRDIDLGNGSGDGKKLKFGGRYTIDNLVLHDIQLSQMKLSEFTPLSEPIQVFDFDLACKKSPIPCHDQTKKEFTAVSTGTAAAVFMWWDCFTDPDEAVLLSCAPFWGHKEGQEQPWRDHWMQAVYFPNTEIKITKGDKIELMSNHDEYSLWFDVGNKKDQECTKAREICHLLPMSRTRLFEVNNSESNEKYIRALRENICNKAKSILCLGDQTVLGLLAAGLCTDAQITIVQENRIMRDLLHQIAEENDLTERVRIVGDCADLAAAGGPPLPFEAVISDVFFNGSVLGWHNLVFWYHVSQLTKDGHISETCISLPGAMSVWMVPVHYQHLWKIRAPLHNIEGFDMTHFDDIIDKASTTCDENVEPQPLWEYPCVALGQPTRVLTLCLSPDNPVPEQPVAYSGALDITGSSTPKLDLNGLALWTTWDLTPELTINTGPASEIRTGEQITWCKGHKQGVHFFKKEHSGAASRVKYNITFQPQEGDFKFEFSTADD